MQDAHRIAHAALAIIYATTAIVLIVNGEIAHALCTGSAALVYAGMCHYPSTPWKPKPTMDSVKGVRRTSIVEITCEANRTVAANGD